MAGFCSFALRNYTVVGTPKGGWMMTKRPTFAGLPRMLAAALLAAGCSDAVGPARHAPTPAFAPGVASGITLDQFNGSINSGPTTVILKGFNPTNPHVGDAIIATFVWLGSTNIITRVSDHLTNGTPVGNTYTLVDYVTAGGISMATYVATNVQNFPDPNPTQETVLVVQADLSSSITDGGVMLSAYTGVNAVFAQAVGAHQSASGAASSQTTADPGAIPVGAGALAYGITMSNRPAGIIGPTGFTPITTQSDASLEDDGEYAVQASPARVEPQWTWFFGQQATWLATVLALNPAAPPSTGNLTVTSSTGGSSLDPDGYTVTVDGTTSQPIATNNSTGITFTGLAAGSHSVALSGVAANCTVTSANPQTMTVPSGGTVTAAFTVNCSATTGNLTVTSSTGGSSLDPDRYAVPMDGTTSQPIATNSSTGVTFTGLAAGTHGVVLSGVAGTCTVSGGASRTVTVPSGGAVTLAYSVSCTTPNRPPIVNAGSDQAVLLGVLYALPDASFSDPDNDGPWSYTIDWGEGPSSSASTSSQGSLTGEHNYLLPGTYRITVTVTDNHGATGFDSKILTVGSLPALNR